MKKITLFAFFLAVLAGCVQKEMTTPVTPSEGQKVTLTFDVNTPESKVAFDDSDPAKLEWTGNETMTLVFGKSGVGGADYNPAAKITIPSASAGVFSGEVTIPSGFTLDDLQAIVVPSECEPYFDWRDSTESRVVMPVSANQVVAGADALNWLYVPFFYDLSTTTKEATSDNNYTFSGLQLKSASDLIRFNVYGATDSDEKLLSVSFSINDTGSSIAGTTHWTLGSTGTGINNGGGSIATVNLETPAVITSEGAKVYAAFLSKNNRVISDVVVKTDKATYYKTFESGNVTLPKTDVSDFCIHPVGLDLSKFTRISGEGKYSSDNGTTWTNELPAKFTSLSVRYDISEAELKAIADAVKAQTSTVDLDMSNSIYVSKIFPAVFQATSSAKNTKLKSMKFPMNIVTIAAHAFDYCTKLESVDLTRMKLINEYAFQYTALKTVSIPSTVTTLGTYAFAYIANMQDVYCNAVVTANNKRYVFCNRHTSYGNSSWNNADSPLKVTFGPNMKAVEYHYFDTNAKLTELVIEAGNVNFYSEWDIRCYNLRRFVFKSTPPNSSSKISTGYSTYSNVKDGVIVVPDDKYSTFASNAMIKALLALTYTEGDQTLNRFKLVKASEDTEE